MPTKRIESIAIPRTIDDGDVGGHKTTAYHAGLVDMTRFWPSRVDKVDKFDQRLEISRRNTL